MEWLIQAHIHSYLNSVLSQVDTDPRPLQDTAHTGSYESQVIAGSKSLMCHVALRHILLSVLLNVVFGILLCEWFNMERFFEKFKNTFIDIYVWKTKQVLTRITWNKSARVRSGWGEVRTGENSLMGFKWSPTWFCQKSHNQIQGDQFTLTKFTKSRGMIQNTSLLTDRGK